MNEDFCTKETAARFAEAGLEHEGQLPQSLALKWLREEKGIFVGIRMQEVSGDYWYEVMSSHGNHWDGVFKHYADAVENAISYCISLINHDKL